MALTPTFLRYFRNTFWLLVERVGRLVLSTIAAIVVLRHLGPERYGALSFAVSFVALFTSFGGLGIDVLLTRELVRHRHPRTVLLGTALSLRIAGIAFAVGAAWAVAAITHETRATCILILVIGAGALVQSASLLRFHFEAEVRSRSVAAAQGIAAVVLLSSSVILVLRDAPLVGFAFVPLAEALALGLALLVAYQADTGEATRWRFSPSVALSLLSDSWPFIVGAVFVMLYMRTDQVMLRYMLGEGAVGQYSAAMRMVEPLFAVPAAIAAGLFPAVVRAKEMSPELYRFRLRGFYSVMTWIGLACALGVSIVGSRLVGLMFGGEYQAAVPVAAIYAWALVFVFQAYASGTWLRTENLQRYSLPVVIFAGCTNVGLNAVMIPTMGPRGAALATVATQGMAALLLPLAFKATRENALDLLRCFNPIGSLRMVRAYLNIGEITV